MIGKLGSPRANLFGEFSRTQIPPLYKELYARKFEADHPRNETKLLHWRVGILSAPTENPSQLRTTPRHDHLHRRRPPKPHDCGLIMRSWHGVPEATVLAEATTPMFRIRKFNKNPISGMEMPAPLELIVDAPNLLRNKSGNLYIDSDTALNALIMGDCPDEALSDTIRSFWKKAEHLCLDIWIGRVHSKVNPSEISERNKSSPFVVLRGVHFRGIFKLLYTTFRI